MELPFLKMNGAGNDFVVIDLRPLAPGEASAALRALTPAAICAIAARSNTATKGCDQLIVLEGGHGRADVFMHIFNADGSTVAACGNATRCVGHLLLAETGREVVRVGTQADVLTAERAGAQVTVDMGAPRFSVGEIPVNPLVNPASIPLEYGPLKNGMAVGMGNPHVVFFVADAQAVDLAALGPRIEREHLEIFPERVNVSVAQVVDDAHITLRVWERGAGLTPACGTAACATLVASATRGLTGRTAEVAMPGGVLTIEWRPDGHVWMTGPVEEEFAGIYSIESAALAASKGQ